MKFTARLREPVMRGEITESVRIWVRPNVKVGNSYALGPGRIVVLGLKEIAVSDITPELARRTGFAGLIDLLKIAKHGRGERAYLVTFKYTPHQPECRRK